MMYRKLYRSGAAYALWPPMMILLAAVSVYSNTFSVPFLFDDKPNIEENVRIRTLWPPWGVLEGTNRPFSEYSFAVNFAVHRYDVWGYHATNLAIHVCASWALYGIGWRTLVRTKLAPLPNSAKQLATIIALLWVVHPLQTQAVTYIVQRHESLMGLAYLLTLYCFIRGQDSQSPRAWYVTSVIACAVGMGCKEVMVTAPVIVLWYDRAFVASSWHDIIDHRKWYYLSLTGTWAVLGWAMMQVAESYSGEVGTVNGVSPWEYLLSQGEIIPYYLWLCFWPQGQCLSYGWPVARTLQEVLPQALVVVALLGATIWCIFRHPKWSFLGGWFFLILAPTSSIVPVLDLAFEHRMYLPLAAVITASVVACYFLIGVMSTDKTVSSTGWKIFGLSTATGVIVALGCFAYSRNLVYGSSITLWTDVTQKAPHHARGWCNLADAIASEGELARGCQLLEQFLELYPNDALARTSLAGLLIDAHAPQSALPHLEYVLRENPQYRDAHINMAHALNDLRLFAGAAQHYQAAVDLKVDNDVRTSLAGVLIPLQRWDEAQRLCVEVLESDPTEVKAVVNLATVFAARGQASPAIQLFQKALLIDAHCADAHAGIAQLLADSDQESALQHMTEALRLKPTSPNMNLGMGSLVARTNPHEAIKYFETALEFQPEDPIALFNIANAWVECGEPEKAIAYLETVVKLTPDWKEAQNNLRILRQYHQEQPQNKVAN